MEQNILKTDHDHHLSKRQKQAQQVINLGLVANTTLAIFKVLGGIFGHSKALLADGINSVSDVIYLTFVKILVKLSGEPADEEHPYGHHQFETIAAVVIGAFIITTGLAIFWDAVSSAYDLFTKTENAEKIQIFTLFIALATIVTKIFLLFNAAHVGKKTNNIAISALAYDHRNDIFSATGAVIGIVFSLFGFNWVDPLAGTIISAFIIKTGFGILRESAAELMDTVPSREMGEKIKKMVEDFNSVIKVEYVHLHRFGPFYVVNISIGLPESYSLLEGDNLSDQVENLLYKKEKHIRKVYIHFHPEKSGEAKKQ